MKTTRFMLIDAKLSQVFGQMQYQQPLILRNWSPTSKIEDMIPYQAWYGKKPGVTHLRVFGSKAYAHVPKGMRKKLDSKTRKCILLGYGKARKGYRIYDREKSQVIFSCNVHFDEDEGMESLHAIQTGGENPEPAQRAIYLGDNEESASEIDQEDEETVPAQQPQLRRFKQSKETSGVSSNFTIHQEPTSFKEPLRSHLKRSSRAKLWTENWIL